ncbi:nuclear transport factor 2 family protein [Streptomyces sp. NPDC002559]
MTQGLRVPVNEFLRRLEACDFSGALALCTEKAVVWQNDGEGEVAMSDRLDHFKSFVTNVDSLRYEVTRQVHNGSELFQQHVLRLNLADGSSDEVHAVVYFRFEDDHIDRIEEYVYTAPEENAR